MFAQVHLVLPAILLAVHFQIGAVNCKSSGSITNSSLKTQATYRYSEAAAFSLPIHQTKAQCLNKGATCTSSKDCCQTTTDGQLACGKFGGTELKCQPCRDQNATCGGDSTSCCAGTAYGCSANTCTYTH